MLSKKNQTEIQIVNSTFLREPQNFYSLVTFILWIVYSAYAQFNFTFASKVSFIVLKRM